MVVKRDPGTKIAPLFVDYATTSFLAGNFQVHGIMPSDMEHSGTTIAVQRYLHELGNVSGNSPAEPIVRELLSRSVSRLQVLCGSILHRNYPRLVRGPTNLCTEELLGGVVERLLKAMKEVRPQTVRQFFALANQHIRWELNDLARRLDRGEYPAALIDSQVAEDSPSTEHTPCQAKVQKILAAIDNLPEEEREVFNLVRLQGMTKAEASSILDVSTKTVQRRLSRSVMRLADWVSEEYDASGLHLSDEGGVSAESLSQ